MNGKEVWPQQYTNTQVRVLVEQVQSLTSEIISLKARVKVLEDTKADRRGRRPAREANTVLTGEQHRV